MSSRFLKSMDASLGAWLCRVMGTFTAQSEIPPPPEVMTPERVRNILVIRPGGIGDMIILLPILSKLQSHFSRATIDIACQSRNCDVLELASLPHATTAFDSSPIRFLADLRRKSYDVTLDTEQFHNFSALFAFLSGAPVRIGFKINPLRNPLYTHLVNYAMDGPEVDQFARLLEPLGIDTGPCDLEESLAGFDADLPAAAAAISDEGRFAVLQAGASTPYKQWPAERFAELAAQIAQKHKMAIAIVGDKSERPAAARVVEAVKATGQRAVSLAGILGLPGTAAVMKRAKLFAGSDSGLAHLARALGVPTVTLFGPSDHLKWGFESARHRVVRNPLPCSPCFIFGFHKPCRTIACMKEIQVNDVLAAADVVLKP